MTTEPYDRAKYVSSGKFKETDILTIRWQAAQPPNGPGLPTTIIAQAWGTSTETIRRIVRRQSYSWVGEQAGPKPPADPRIKQALADALAQSIGAGSMKALEERLLAIQAEVAAGARPKARPRMQPSENETEGQRKYRETMENADREVEGYGVKPRKPPPPTEAEFKQFLEESQLDAPQAKEDE
jgi:hypothetical protein